MDQSAAMLVALIEKSMNLGSEWTVADAEFRHVDGGKDELHIYIVRTPGRSIECPGCGARSGVYDTRPREWRHLDIWQFKTIIHCDVPRTDCTECGVRTARVPWEGDSCHFTALFEAQALAMLMAGMTVAGAAGVLEEHDTRLWRLVCAAVDRARKSADYSGVKAVGMDETSRKKGHNYLTAFVDAPAKRVMFAVEGKDAATVGAFAADFAEHGGDPAAVSTVTCDMSPAFLAGIAEHLPNASVIIDRFHAMQPFSRAIDLVRTAECRESAEKRLLLKRTKYVWLKRDEGLTDGQAATKERLARKRLKTARACMMKDEMASIYDECADREEAEARLSALTSWMMRSRLDPMKDVARTLRSHWDEILNYFDHRFTNAVLEGINSMIQVAKRAARGFKNTRYFKAVIYLNLGKLHFPQLDLRVTH